MSLSGTSINCGVNYSKVIDIRTIIGVKNDAPVLYNVLRKAKIKRTMINW